MKGRNQAAGANFRLCDEIHVYAGVAERTGAIFEIRGLKSSPHVCRTMTDLARKYRLNGDGLYYLREGQWPKEQSSIPLADQEWIGVCRAFERSRTSTRRSGPLSSAE